MVRRLPYKRIILCGTIGLIGLFLAHRVFFFTPSFFEYYSSSLIYPFLVAQRSVAEPVKNYFKSRKSLQELEQALVRAQQECDSAVAKAIELTSLISFAQDTHEIIEFKKRYDFSNALLAHVLLKNFTSQCHFFLLDKGTKAGVEKDMVAVYKDCIVGRVIEVYPYYSKLLLVTDCSCKVAAYCAQSKATGIYQGTNQEWAAYMDHVSHLCQLETNELVVSSGDGLVFPRGFGLGKVQSFITEGLFHHVCIQPLLDMHNITYCYIVRK